VALGHAHALPYSITHKLVELLIHIWDERTTLVWSVVTVSDTGLQRREAFGHFQEDAEEDHADDDDDDDDDDDRHLYSLAGNEVKKRVWRWHCRGSDGVFLRSAAAALECSKSVANESR
jgi:hypothetical protein